MRPVRPITRRSEHASGSRARPVAPARWGQTASVASPWMRERPWRLPVSSGPSGICGRYRNHAKAEAPSRPHAILARVSEAGPVGRLIIVSGLPGAGKTTLARQLELDCPGFRLCPDEWMAALAIDVYDAPARERIEQLQWQLAQRVLVQGTTVIVEW